ncbi:hypothetical protein, partial [[Flexibacter] sp. ATCC 35208]|uniref:hypothetical protein n=1 Tax=[Flexibacter] sp. ATCC 35208 TaxID=1936242 RepID=UPI0009CE702E
MNFVSFINEFINPAIPKYHELLIEDFKKSLPYTGIVNRLFYKGNSLEEFLDWHKNMRPLGFDYIKINSKGSSIGRFCRIEELDNIQHVFRYIKEEDINRFNFFLEDEYSSFEDAKASFPRPYYYIRGNFVEILDGILFSSLSGFTRDKRQSSLFEKVLFENVSLIFDTNRNDMYYKGIESYIFPDLIFKINGKKIKINLQTDLKSLIFLSEVVYT